ncbi:MAG: rRNA (guanine966-N2)-methyltransferase [Frankiaceae bacterium]|jgi:16S rRNA (guanine966-N2)-methyltransferase|nr:rRNA (guanine966-N2)-methyltransferase [Frankiaceae bacterium]
MTRIVGGSAGGRRLSAPPGRTTRPTSDRTREGLFSALEARYGSLAGRSFLDLFAGSGAVGLEAASRGAMVVLVERDPRAITALRANVAELALPGVSVRPDAVERFLETSDRFAFDVCFLDPPYADPVTRALELLVANEWLGADPTVVVERASRDPAPSWPDGLVGHRSRRYGDSTLWYGRRS